MRQLGDTQGKLNLVRNLKDVHTGPKYNAPKIPYKFYNNFIIYSGYELSQTGVFPRKLINCEK